MRLKRSANKVFVLLLFYRSLYDLFLAFTHLCCFLYFYYTTKIRPRLSLFTFLSLLFASPSSLTQLHNLLTFRLTNWITNWITNGLTKRKKKQKRKAKKKSTKRKSEKEIKKEKRAHSVWACARYLAASLFCPL